MWEPFEINSVSIMITGMSNVQMYSTIKFHHVYLLLVMIVLS